MKLTITMSGDVPPLPFDVFMDSAGTGLEAP